MPNSLFLEFSFGSTLSMLPLESWFLLSVMVHLLICHLQSQFQNFYLNQDFYLLIHCLKFTLGNNCCHFFGSQMKLGFCLLKISVLETLLIHGSYNSCPHFLHFFFFWSVSWMSLFWRCWTSSFLRLCGIMGVTSSVNRFPALILASCPSLFWTSLFWRPWTPMFWRHGRIMGRTSVYWFLAFLLGW